MQTVSALVRIILPLVVFYLAFTCLGTAGGLVVVVLYFALMNLSAIFNHLASRAYTSGDYDKALRLLEKALKLSPKNSAMRGAYAWLLLKLGNTGEAEIQIDQALANAAREEQKSTLNVTKSMVLWKKGELDQAISLLEKVLESYKNSNVYATLGFLYLEKGDLDKALSFNLEAYDFNSTNAIILDNLGCTRLLRGEYEEAREIYMQLMKLKPQFPEAFYNYARVLAHFGELDKAIYMCRTALSLKFWNTSTITREQVENTLMELEDAQEKRLAETAGNDGHEAMQEEKSDDINSKE